MARMGRRLGWTRGGIRDDVGLRFPFDWQRCHGFVLLLPFRLLFLGVGDAFAASASVTQCTFAALALGYVVERWLCGMKTDSEIKSGHSS